MLLHPLLVLELTDLTGNANVLIVVFMLKRLLQCLVLLNVILVFQGEATVLVCLLVDVGYYNRIEPFVQVVHEVTLAVLLLILELALALDSHSVGQTGE